MFNPSRDQVRSFFIETWRKHRAREVLTPMETIAADIIGLHPEYHAIVEDPDAIDRDFTPEDLNLLTVMANIAAVRLEHARLAEIEQAERIMARDIAPALKSLIPAELVARGFKVT